MIRKSMTIASLGVLAMLAACQTAEKAEPASAPAPAAAAPAPAPAPNPIAAAEAAGGQIWNTRCVGCHGGRAPALAVLASTKTPADVVAALSPGGKMASQGSSLSNDDRRAVATFITKQPI